MVPFYSPCPHFSFFLFPPFLLFIISLFSFLIFTPFFIGPFLFLVPFLFLFSWPLFSFSIFLVSFHFFYILLAPFHFSFSWPLFSWPLFSFYSLGPFSLFILLAPFLFLFSWSLFSFYTLGPFSLFISLHPFSLFISLHPFFYSLAPFLFVLFFLSCTSYIQLSTHHSVFFFVPLRSLQVVGSKLNPTLIPLAYLITIDLILLVNIVLVKSAAMVIRS